MCRDANSDRRWSIRSLSIFESKYNAQFIQIYRIWVVYKRSGKVLPVPVLLWLGTAASGGGVLFGEITTVEGTVGNSNVKNFIIALWTCSIAMNLLGTGKARTKNYALNLD
jgi:hypothetical protein